MSSPTFDDYQDKIRSQQTQLLSTKLAMETLLTAEREDVDKQFDEKQGSWKQLAPYTVAKKEEANADPRTLHETRAGSGLRLRDAYKQTGHVEEDGTLVFDYPVEKPYAQDHQEGVVGEPSKTEKRFDKPKKLKKRRKSIVEQRNDKLDREYEDRFFR
jgi:hypothetical protein